MNLILDENKIRKGKPVGLPYVGSKKKISKKIVEIIKQNFGTDKTVYDVFGGGGAVTAELMINGMDVVYNDLDTTITDMFNRVLSQDRDWIKTLIVSCEEFFNIKDKELKTVDDELKLLVNSFGNDRKTYLYSKELSDIKYNLSIKIIEEENVFSCYKQTETYQKAIYKKIDKNDRLKRLQQLERLQKTEKLKQYTTMNKDYHFFSNVKDRILYLDPPYENSDISKYKITSFNYQEFYDWAYEMSKNNIVLLSSYEVSDDRFERIYEFKGTKSTLSPKRGNRCEKLFMVNHG